MPERARSHGLDLLRQGHREAGLVHLHEAEQPVHPRQRAPRRRHAHHAHHDVGPPHLQHAAADFHERAHRHAPAAFERQHPPQHQVGVRAGGPAPGGVGRLEGIPQQAAGVERAVVVGVGGQDEPVARGFDAWCHGLVLPQEIGDGSRFPPEIEEIGSRPRFPDFRPAVRPRAKSVRYGPRSRRSADVARIDLGELFLHRGHGAADLVRGVPRRDEKPEAGSALLHRRIEDRLHVDAAVEEVSR